MRQSMYDNKAKRRDRHDDVVNVGTSRGASRRNKPKGEPISVPSNSGDEKPRKIQSISRIARMQTSQASRIPSRNSGVIESVTRKNTRHDLDDEEENVIEVESDEEKKPTKLKRRRLIKPVESDDEGEDNKDEPFSFSSFIKPSFPRRRTLHSPLGNFAAKRDNLPTLSQSVARTTNFHRLKSIYKMNDNANKDKDDDDDDDDDDGLGVLKDYTKSKENSGSSRKVHSEEYKGISMRSSNEARKARDKVTSYVEEKDEIDFTIDTPVKRSSPVILPYDPIDDYEIQPSGTDEHLLTYPFKAKKSVTVYERDFERLNEETYINDTLIDVFPKIWADEFSNTSIYTFSSFFFTKLAGPHNTMNYDTVKRWTANEDIFKKKCLIIPIAQHNHWFLVVVANPGYCIQGPKGNLYHPEFMEDEEERKAPIALKKRSRIAGTPLDLQKPYIILLDPLHLNKPGAAKMIIRYLKEEAIQRLNIDSSDFTTPEVVMSACPGQDNFTDCGVFCLHYMKSIYQYTDDMMKTFYTNESHDDTWDKDSTLPGFRTHLKRMLKKKMKNYREYLFSKLD